MVRLTDKQRAMLAAQDPEDLYGQLAAIGRAPVVGRPRSMTDKQMWENLSPQQRQIIERACAGSAAELVAYIGERIVRMGSKENLERVIDRYRKAIALFELTDPGERFQEIALRVVNETQTQIEEAVTELRATAPEGSKWRDLKPEGASFMEQELEAIAKKKPQPVPKDDEDEGDDEEIDEEIERHSAQG